MRALGQFVVEKACVVQPLSHPTTASSVMRASHPIALSSVSINVPSLFDGKAIQPISSETTVPEVSSERSNANSTDDVFALRVVTVKKGDEGASGAVGAIIFSLLRLCIAATTLAVASKVVPKGTRSQLDGKNLLCIELVG